MSDSDTVRVVWLLMVMPPKHIFKAQALGLILHQENIRIGSKGEFSVNSEKQRTFEWYEFIPHVLAVITILCCVIVFAASFTGLAVLQFNWIQRCFLGGGAVILAIMLLRWIGQDQKEARLAKTKPLEKNTVAFAASSSRPVAGLPDITVIDEKADSAVKYEYMRFKVKGVTFDNDDGTNRQDILYEIANKEPPFDGKLTATIEEIQYNNEPAFAVLVNDYRIGSVPKECVNELLQKWSRIDKISSFSLVGGGEGEYSGEDLYYGVRITVRFFEDVK